LPRDGSAACAVQHYGEALSRALDGLGNFNSGEGEYFKELKWTTQRTRGDMENRIKKRQLDMPIAPRPGTMRPTSCGWFPSMGPFAKRNLRHHSSQAAQDRGAHARSARSRPRGVELSRSSGPGLPCHSSQCRRKRAWLACLTRAAPARHLRGIIARPIRTSSPLPPQSRKSSSPATSPDATGQHDRRKLKQNDPTMPR
jgi:hypothetical protein